MMIEIEKPHAAIVGEQPVMVIDRAQAGSVGRWLENNFLRKEGDPLGDTKTYTPESLVGRVVSALKKIASGESLTLMSGSTDAIGGAPLAPQAARTGDPETDQARGYYRYGIRELTGVRVVTSREQASTYLESKKGDSMMFIGDDLLEWVRTASNGDFFKQDCGPFGVRIWIMVDGASSTDGVAVLDRSDVIEGNWGDPEIVW